VYLFGSIVIITGVLISVIPYVMLIHSFAMTHQINHRLWFYLHSVLLNYDKCDESGHSRSELTANAVILLVGIVPAAISAVYKQNYLAESVSIQTHYKQMLTNYTNRSIQ
jgi:hypothetical protein